MRVGYIAPHSRSALVIVRHLSRSCGERGSIFLQSAAARGLSSLPLRAPPARHILPMFAGSHLMRRTQAGPQRPSRSLRARSRIPLRHWLRAAALAVAGISFLGYAAEGPIASVQRSLKEQQFYFGEVNGQLDEETRAAVRRYQIHQGIPVSGELDTVTLQALQSATGTAETHAAPTQDTPAVAERSVRGRARNLEQDDREFLEQLEGSPGSSAPPAPEPRSMEPQTAQTPPAAERPKQATPPAPEQAGLTADAARQFVEDYLDAAEQPTPEEEVSFFADRVDYFDSGKVNRRFIEKDQRNYYRRWTSRKFDLIDEPEVLRSSGDSATVRFRVRYALRNKTSSSQGKVEEIVRLQRTGDGWKIAGIRERKLPD